MHAASAPIAATPSRGIANGSSAGRRRTRGRAVARRRPTVARASVTSEKAVSEISERTRRLLTSIEGTEGEQASGAGGGTTLAALERADAAWRSIRHMKTGAEAGPAPVFVTESDEELASASCDYDVAVCGGTLGILLAAALQHRGQRVVVIERGFLKGREQEWNISRPELEALVPLGVLTAAQADTCVTKEFNPIRCGFHGSGRDPMVTRDILNCGVKPSALLECARANFERKGGIVMERAALAGIDVRPNGALLDVAPASAGASAEKEAPEMEKKSPKSSPQPCTARLVVDCMGFGSPIVRQQRHGQKPDGVCLVVGSCARGFEPAANASADLIFTTTDIDDAYQGQYFWEAFPAGSGPCDRTTYMFTYVDAHESRPSLAKVLDDYWDLMPPYQNLRSVEEVELLRVLFGYFPTYRDSPLPAGFDRVTAIGDASGIQSPLSFGGLAALLRHVGRLTDAMEDALLSDVLDRECLATLNAYQPALSASWLFQKCMSVAPGTRPPKTFINQLMATNFGVMESLGDEVSRPFLQDVVMFGGLGKTLLTMAVKAPLFVPQILAQAGPGPILDWAKHFATLGAYDVASRAAEGILKPVARALAGVAPSGELVAGDDEASAAAGWDFAVLDKRQRFMFRRRLDAWKWGSGRDYRAE